MKGTGRGLAALFALVIASAAMADDKSAEKDILRVEAELLHAWETGDAATVRRDLDPSFTLVDSKGAITDYAANVAEVEKRDPAYTVFRNRDQAVRVYGDSAVVIGITRVEGTSGGANFTAEFRFTDTWVKRDGQWKLAASHASRLPE
ncbi:nuclear transport factor 2 family protein [Noviluteimonas gilva]|nr:nuclear transport factor 2 family protein [Lysobacter gilvus]